MNNSRKEEQQKRRYKYHPVVPTVFGVALLCYAEAGQCRGRIKVAARTDPEPARNYLNKIQIFGVNTIKLIFYTMNFCPPTSPILCLGIGFFKIIYFDFIQVFSNTVEIP